MARDHHHPPRLAVVTARVTRSRRRVVLAWASAFIAAGSALANAAHGQAQVYVDGQATDAQTIQGYANPAAYTTARPARRTYRDVYGSAPRSATVPPRSDLQNHCGSQSVNTVMASLDDRGPKAEFAVHTVPPPPSPLSDAASISDSASRASYLNASNQGYGYDDGGRDRGRARIVTRDSAYASSRRSRDSGFLDPYYSRRYNEYHPSYYRYRYDHCGYPGYYYSYYCGPYYPYYYGGCTPVFHYTRSCHSRRFPSGWCGTSRFSSGCGLTLRISF